MQPGTEKALNFPPCDEFPIHDFLGGMKEEGKWRNTIELWEEYGMVHGKGYYLSGEKFALDILHSPRYLVSR